MTIRDSIRITSKKRLAIGTLLGCLLLSCWITGRRESSLRGSYSTLRQQISQMQADVAAIERLRHAPQIATERIRPNDELLNEVRNAMTAANMSAKRWVANDPSPPFRIPRSPYKKLDTRLSFNEVSLRELTAFAVHLVEANPSVSITDIRLLAPRSDKSRIWNVEITVSYLIYAPYHNRPA